MKKLISLTLCILLVLGLFAACGTGGGETTGGDQAAAGTFQVGFCSVDITPDFTVPTGMGTYNTDGVREHIYTTCIALRSANGETYLIYTNDLCTSTLDPIGFIIKKIDETTGIPTGNVLVHATHTHKVPRLESTEDSITKYKSLLSDWMVEAAVGAIADLKSAKMYISSIETKNMNFIRHYLMKDGTVAGDNFGNHSSGYVDQVSDPDPMLQLVKFTREGGKDVILANFQTHPHRAAGNIITSDMVGVMRDEVQQLLGCEFAYFTGAAGNINPHSKFAEDNVTKDYQEQGIALAEYALEAAADFREIEVGEVQLQQYSYVAEVKEGTGTASDINMNVLSVGEFAFVSAAYEMFDSNGRYIKENSPFEMTFVATLGYYKVPYIPDYDGYEYEGVGLSYEGEECRYVRGTGELLAEKYVEMLNELYKTK